MNIILRFKQSIENNVRLWIALWLLILLNVFAFITFSKRLSLTIALCFIILALLGAAVLRLLAQVSEEVEIEISPEIKANVDEIMYEIKPLCEEVFDQEITKAIDPIIEELRIDFFKGVKWLWEDSEDFINDVGENLGDTDSILQLFTLTNEERRKIAQDLRNSVSAIDATISGLNKSKENDFKTLNEKLDMQRENLKETMEKEKEVFYEHIYKILVQEVETEEDFDPMEHFDTYKLADQFAHIIERSLDEKLSAFHEMSLEHLEEFSSDIVGRMQKNTTLLLNNFRDNQTVLERLVNECSGESNLLLHRLDELLSKNVYLQEKASEILVTLAWEDILVEKRWQEMKEKLYLTKDFVRNSVDEEVINYIKESVDQQIPGISYMIKQAEGTIFYKNLLDAELVFQVYRGRKLTNLLEEGVKVLLLFIRPIEMLAHRSIRLNDKGLKMRKYMHKRTKTGEFDENFNKIKNLVEEDNSLLEGYLEDIFPQEFYSFCNSHYVKRKPKNLSIAAWSLFLSLIADEIENDEIYILVGLLLIVHNLRNKYIHPLKSALLELEDEKEIDVLRYLTYRIINIVIQNELKGTTSLSYKYN
ncbi:MAG TPA: hypothetical protein VFC73_02385 [Syntrophomonadaceae bacterium]|nr:hypothetical protein [Syntrophomonadaceae bacterium]